MSVRSSSSSVNISPEEQAKILENSIAVIKQQILLMRKFLDVTNKKTRLMDALKHASTFLSELRTNLLTPKQYYELYILVFDGLNYLSVYLKENHLNNHLANLYELVQYAGNIVPRLYLMITVGTVYMSIPDAPIKEIMKDMIDMCRGVQHPIRGLFLRYYLTQRTKDLLPVKVTAISEHSGKLEDSIQFIITNFIEMNKLWVRLQHQGHSSERNKRIKERQELQILVGSNLVRLSQLDHIDSLYYKDHILPTVLEQITQCRDVIAQEYLLDVIIQVFPDDFQLATLDDFLNATLNLNPEVSLKKILITLINRLVGYKKREEIDDVSEKLKTIQLNTDEERGVDDITNDIDLFGKVWNYVQKLIEQKPSIHLEDLSTILDALTKLSITYYPSNYENLSQIYGYAIEVQKNFETNNSIKSKESSELVNANWRLLALSPIYNLSNLLDLLNIEHYYEFLESQHNLKKIVAIEIIEKILKNDVKITEINSIHKMFQLLSFIIESKHDDNNSGKSSAAMKRKLNKSLLFGNDETDSLKSASISVASDNHSSIDNIETVIQQENLAKILHFIYNVNPFINFELLVTAKSYLSKGGLKIKFTYPTLINITLRLIRKLKLMKLIDLKKNDVLLKIKTMFKFISSSVNELYELHQQITLTSINTNISTLCLNLNLMTAQLADEIGLCDISNEFFIQSFVIYEESIVDSRLQYQSILSMIGKLHQCHNLITISPENYDNLITKTALYGSKLLKKTDQCRAVYLASHLWWIVEENQDNESEEEILQPIKKDGKRVLECLQKSLRIADSCLDNSVSLELFTEILNRCLYYFIHGNEVITTKYINGLIELIQNNIKSFENSTNENGTNKSTGNDNEDENDEDDDDIEDSAKKHFKRTLKYIDEQKKIDERFQEIVY
ncbi:hypothetical protein PACTADRAFT_49536 [Pachysolen tannophilus NRRL Y-2460]|uniref:Vacuolar protein sorting-associated protein 35 n=1 Tax=Pachysolen tannophilus NRRL Y-2460 TaxID=669874 RepID=A0A1E4TWM0_PACTA|nr:hypothetical protein PACTADRAFT_49536 [Pachysolen tannophilus NRRL Y-2460]